MIKHAVSVLDNKLFQDKFIEVLEAKSAQLVEHFQEAFYSKLSKPEKEVQRYVDSLSFSGGAWYRPIHNMLVTLAVKAIVQENKDLSIALIYAAQLHDIGYCKIDIDPTIMGPDWASADKRIEHMRLGRKMTEEFLGRTMPELPIDQKNLILEIVGNHDNRYIGKSLPDLPEHLAHYDADSSFVITAVSWYKDMIAYAAKGSYRENLIRLGLQVSPEAHALRRSARFLEDDGILFDAGILNGQTQQKNPFRATEEEQNFLASFSVSEKIYNHFFKSRLAELPLLNELFTNQDQIDTFIEQSITADLQYLLNLVN